MMAMTQEEIDAMLASQRIGRLSMADAQGRPYTIPLPFCWLGGALYLRLPMTGRKGSILRTNNRVCFEVDWWSERMDDYASVLIEGRLEPVHGPEEKRQARLASDEKYLRLRGGFRPGHGRNTPLETLPLQKIQVDCLAGRKKESRPPASAITMPGRLPDEVLP